MSLYFAAFVIVLLSYFLGCLNGAVITSHFVIRDDVRSHGSGNAGLTNFYRTYGARYALLVILLDMGKTAAAVEIGGYMFGQLYNDWVLGALLGGAGAVVGHIFPVFYGFKGGKGILSGGMLLILLDWRIALVGWSLFIILAVATKYVSLGSIAATVSFPITAFFIYDHNMVYVILGALIAALVVYSHRGNVQRLLTGTEHKFHWHVDPEKNKGKEN